LDDILYTCHSRVSAGINMTDLSVDRGSAVQYDDQESEKSKKLPKSSNVQNDATRFCLRKELELAFCAFSKLYVQLATLLSESDVGDCSIRQGTLFLEPLEFVHILLEINILEGT